MPQTPRSLSVMRAKTKMVRRVCDATDAAYPSWQRLRAWDDNAIEPGAEVGKELRRAREGGRGVILGVAALAGLAATNLRAGTARTTPEAALLDCRTHCLYTELRLRNIGR